MSRARRRAWTALRLVAIVVVVAACAWFLRSLDLRAALDALRGARVLPIVVAAVLNFVLMVLRARVLRLLLFEARPVPTARLFRYNLVTYAMNNLLPGRAGEVLRLYLLKTREGVPASTSLAAALLERVMEALALLLVAAPLPLLVESLPRWAAITLALLGAVGIAGVGGAFALARRAGDATHLSRFAAGLSTARDPRTFAEVLVLSVGVWILDGVNIALCLYAVNVPVHGVVGPLVVMLALALALAVPSTPAQVGAFELACVAALELVGVQREPALAFAVLFHLMQIVPVTIAGLGGLRLIGEARAAAAREGIEASGG